MKWTAYYITKNAITGKIEEVYLEEYYKTKKELIKRLESMGCFASDLYVKDNIVIGHDGKFIHLANNRN